MNHPDWHHTSMANRRTHMNQTEECNRPQCWCNRPTTNPGTTSLAARLLHAETAGHGGVAVTLHSEGPGAYVSVRSDVPKQGFAHTLAHLDDLPRFNPGTFLSVGESALVQGF